MISYIKIFLLVFIFLSSDVTNNNPPNYFRGVDLYYAPRGDLQNIYNQYYLPLITRNNLQLYYYIPTNHSNPSTQINYLPALENRNNEIQPNSISETPENIHNTEEVTPDNDLPLMNSDKSFVIYPTSAFVKKRIFLSYDLFTDKNSEYFEKYYPIKISINENFNLLIRNEKFMSNLVRFILFEANQKHENILIRNKNTIIDILDMIYKIKFSSPKEFIIFLTHLFFETRFFKFYNPGDTKKERKNLFFTTETYGKQAFVATVEFWERELVKLFQVFTFENSLIVIWPLLGYESFDPIKYPRSFEFMCLYRKVYLKISILISKYAAIKMS